MGDRGMKQTCANPNPANGAYGRNGNFYTDVIFVDPVGCENASGCGSPVGLPRGRLYRAKACGPDWRK